MHELHAEARVGRGSGIHTARRVVLFVIDGLGVGELPDAPAYGDQGSNTLLHAAQQGRLRARNLDRLGLGRVQPAPGLGEEPSGAYGRMTEVSAGKDSMTGHWELAGIITQTPYETFPNGFGSGVLQELSRSIGVPVIGNVVSPGIEAMNRFGEESWRTGSPIVYTSADSVFQMAAHIDLVPADLLYGWCEIARVILGDRVGRVIARPFTGEPGSFRRIETGRRDFPVHLPPGSLLHILCDAGIPTVGIGKVCDMFPGHPFDAVEGPGSNDTIVLEATEWLKRESRGLVFANAGELDSKYAHRNDPQGWCSAFEHLDDRLGLLLACLEDDDAVFITGDHGNDPTTPSTDHSREYVPILATSGAGWRRGGPPADLGVRSSFADVGATIAELLLGTPTSLPGESFSSLVP
ncbi:MAG TPA: phosphopentomutase [Actinomycetota bacterium]|nr:phosphopentomutase [Actinomycetota bacterium]